MRKKYRTDDKIKVLTRELFLLREALLRTAHDAIYLPDLLRSLRVLIVDKTGKPVLLNLAEEFHVSHQVTTVPPIAPKVRSQNLPPGSVSFDGILAVASLDPYSGWLALRGAAKTATVPGLTVDFVKYLDMPTAADEAKKTQISRKDLISDVLNKAHGVHGSVERPPHVDISFSALTYGSHIALVAQDLAYETLGFGDKIVGAVAASGRHIGAAGAYRSATCPSCTSPMAFAAFRCDKCGHDQTPPLTEAPDAHTGLNSMLLSMLELDEGTTCAIATIPRLIDPSAGEFVVAEARDSAGRYARLVRTPNVTLEWAVSRQGQVHRAILDLRKRTLKGGPNDALVFFLGWTTSRCFMEIGSTSNDLWATSDGLPIRSDA